MLKKLAYIFLGLLLLSVATAWVYIHFTQEKEELTEEVREKIGGSFVKLSQGHVHYQLQGPETGPSILLIHGAGSGYYAWDKNYQYLVDHGYRVLRYDLYGRGFSDRPEVQYDSTIFYTQLHELIDTLHLKPPLTIVAVSMGATIAIQFTAKHLQDVKQLILVDPASLSDGSLAWYLKNPLISPLLMSLYWYPRAVEKQMKEYYNPQAVPEYREKSWEQLKYKGLKRAMLSTWQHTLTLNMGQQLKKIGKSEVEVLLVWGRYDPLIPPTASKSYIEAMPRAKYYEIDSAGHLANYERPASFNEIVSNFLKK